MNIEPFYDDLTPVIESVASEYARRYSHFGLEQGDAANSCWLWLYEHPSKVLDFFENGTEQGVRLIARTLRNELHDIGEDAKAQHLGYSRDDLAYYSKAYVRSLLPSMFDDEAWIHPEQSDGERRAPSDPATGGNWITTLADVARAYAHLDAYDRDLLAAFHRDGWTNKMSAMAEGVSEQTMSYRHDRAVNRLVRLLGGHKPRPQHFLDCARTEDPTANCECDCCVHYSGRRRSMSNAQARAYQQSAYEE